MSEKVQFRGGTCEVSSDILKLYAMPPLGV